MRRILGLGFLLVAGLVSLAGCRSESPEPSTFKKPPPPSERMPKPPVDKGT